MSASLHFIGSIQTPYETLDDCPGNVRQDGPECQIILHHDYAPALMGLKAGQTILVLYWFDQSDRTLLIQRRGGRPDGEECGTFALRSPHRPNPIAAAILPIQDISDNCLTVRGLDCLNGTLLLDIKPAIGLEAKQEQ